MRILPTPPSEVGNRTEGLNAILENQLPADYVKFLRTFDGGFPVPPDPVDMYVLPDVEPLVSVDQFASSIEIIQQLARYMIYPTWGYFPENAIPIALGTGGGWGLVFSGDCRGTVLLLDDSLYPSDDVPRESWDPDYIRPVAKSFTEFLDRLVPISELEE